MCLIIAPGKDGKPALLPREAFDYAYSRNKDGFGGMWVEDGRVNHFKTLGLSADETYAKMEEIVEDHPGAIFHLRLKTHGKIIPGLSHPFRILSKGRHGKDMFFMHNGVLGSFGNHLTYGQSDTTVFKDKILVPLLTRDPDALEDPEVWEALEKLTSGSRLVFMDSDGKTYFTSENGWSKRYDLMLSNTYMLPYESTVTPPRSNLPTVLTGDNIQVTNHLIYFRQIDREGVVSGKWCSCPKLGYVRSEAGLLYKDHGTNVKIYHAVDFIPKEEEYKHLGLQLVNDRGQTIGTFNADNDVGSSVMEDEFDDDLPFELSPSVDRSEAPPKGTSSGIAPADDRLRYARLVHNTYAGKVTSRPHLMGDLIGMSEEEFLAFVDQDPEVAATAFAEVIEMVLEYNDELLRLDPKNEKVLVPEEVLRLGQADYHRDAIQEVARIRKQEYEAQLKRFNEIVDGPGEIVVN